MECDETSAATQILSFFVQTELRHNSTARDCAVDKKKRQPGGVPNVESELWEAQAAHMLDNEV